MGQYHYTVNLDKKQFLHPHKLGDGLKLLEQCGSLGGVNTALHLLLAACSGRGGGDFQSDSELIGSWAGDRIAVVGDYAEADDIPGCNAAEVWNAIHAEGSEWRDLSDELIPILERECEIVYVGDGWRGRIQFDRIEGYAGSHGRGDRTIMIGQDGYPSSEVVAALKKYFHGRRYERGNVTAAQLDLTPIGKTQAMVRPA